MMTRMQWPFFAVLLAAVLSLCGCSGHYRFSDDQYRPLGEPTSTQRSE